MIITIQIDTSVPEHAQLTDHDKSILRAFLGENGSTPTEETAAPAKAAPAARATRQPRKSAPAQAEPEPAEEPQEDVEDSTGPTVDDAIARATELMQAGKTSDVKLALAGLGAKRVSELAGDKVAAFLSELEDL